VFDRRTVYIGSLNLDPRSTWLNTEIGLLVHSPALAKQVAQWFERATRPASSFAVQCAPSALDCDGPDGLVWVTQEEGKTVQYRSEPYASLARKFEAEWWSLLPIDPHL
jgi:putative cardiolipin synthase